MPRKPSTAVKTGSVQKFIGTAYDNMKELKDNIPWLQELHDNLDNSLKYLGGHESPPSSRLDGSDLQDGDYYFDTVLDALVYYDTSDGSWFSVDPNEVLAARDAAINAQISAESSRDDARAAEAGAETAQGLAELAQGLSEGAQAKAETAQSLAEAAQAGAETAETNAQSHATTAEAEAANAAADAANTAADVLSSGSNASDAASHATSAQNSATAAQLAQQQAEQAFENFDDRYLGAFASHPSTDNDGDPLAVGTTYFNTTEDLLYYYNGAAWESPDKAASESAAAAAASAATATTQAGNAANSATASLNAKTDSVAAKNAAEDAQAAAETAEVGAEAAETAAQASASAASTSETNAANSESAAGTSEVNAESAKTAAEAAQAAAEAASINGMGMSQAQFDANKEQRKREGAGSGFAEWGNHYTSNTEWENINQGMFVNGGTANNDNNMRLLLGEHLSPLGTSRTESPQVIVDGVHHHIDFVNVASGNSARIEFPDAPDGAKSLNATTGEVHKYHDKPGVGTEYEAYTVDFDSDSQSGTTWIDLTTEPYVMPYNSTFSMKFKYAGKASGNSYLLDTETPQRVYVYLSGSTGKLVTSGFKTVRLNGEPIPDVVIEEGVEYILTGEINVPNVSFETIGARFSGDESWAGEIWDINFTSNEESVAPLHINTCEFQPKADVAPVITAIDAGDNPDMPAGYQPDYSKDGKIIIPEFPLADKMNLSMTFRVDSADNSMLWGNPGDNDTGASNMRLYWYVLHTNTFTAGFGNAGLPFNTELDVGRIYTADYTIRKNVGQSTYTVTATLNGETLTRSDIVFDGTEFKAFGLGGYGSSSDTTSFMDGQIFNFTLEYPDAPDLNREYLSIEDVDPAGRLTVEDDLGFTTEDWTPDWTNSPDQYVGYPEWRHTGTGEGNHEITFVVHCKTLGAEVYICNNTEDSPFIASSPSGELYWDKFGSVEINGVPTDSRTLTMEVGNQYHVKCRLADGQYLDSVGNYYSGFEVQNPVTDLRFTDFVTPENSRHYPLVINSATQPDTLVAEDALYDKDTAPFYTPDYGSDGYTTATIPVWTPTDGTIKAKVRFDVIDASYQILFRATANDSTILGLDAGQYIYWHGYSGVTEVKIDGNAIVSGTFYPVAGTEYEVEVSGDFSATELGMFGNTDTGHVNSLDGAMWDIELTDNTDSTNSRYYPCIVYSPDAPHTGTVLEDVLKPDLTRDRGFDDEALWTRNFGWTVSGGIASRRGATGNNWIRSIDLVNFQAGHTYFFSYDRRWIANGNTTNLYFSNGDGGSVTLGSTSEASGNWITVTDTYTPTVSYGEYIQLYGIGNTEVDIDNFFIYDMTDGTLVNFPANSEWTLAQTDEQQTAGTLENFTVGLEWDNDLPITDGTMVGFATPWFYESGRYDVSIIGNTTMKPMSLQDAQKCFLEAKYTGFEPILSRKDFVFLETWKEDVSLKDIVNPLGNTQYAATSYDELPTSGLVGLGVGQGYSAFGEWDENTQGLGWKWSHLTVEQQRKILDDPKHNLVWNTEEQKLYQHRYRIRVVEGLGELWRYVTPAQSKVGVTSMHYDPTHTITRQMDKETSSDYGGEIFVTANHSASAVYGTNDHVYEYQGGYALPIALVQRLNQGGHHPALNPQGAACFLAANGSWRHQWWSGGLLNYPDATEDCFKFTTATSVDNWTDNDFVYHLSGDISDSISGRSDQYDFCDAIYAGQVEDLRLNANKQDYARLREDATRSDVAGTTRGKGKVPFTVVESKVLDIAQAYQGKWYINCENNDGYEITPDQRKYSAIYNVSRNDILYPAYTEPNGNIYLTSNPDARDASNIPFVRDTALNSWAVGETVLLVIGDDSVLGAEYDSLPWVDIYADPERLAALFPDGVVGEWNPHIPDATPAQELLRKSNSTTGTYVQASATNVWSSGSRSIDGTTNTIGISPSVDTVTLVHYEALSNFTEPDDNRAVQGELGDVHVTQNYHQEWGNRLMPSLIDVIATSSNSGARGKTYNMTSHYLQGGELFATSGYEPTHESIDLPTPTNDSDAVKTLTHLVEKDGLLYLQHHATQLVHQPPVYAGVWTAGDTKNVEAGQVYLMNGFSNSQVEGQHFIMEETKSGVTMQATTFSGWYLSEDGYVRTISGGTFSLVDMKIFNPTNAGWGDDSEITIVDDESTKTDTNGNTVKVVTHTHMIPIGIAHKNETK